MSTETKKKIGDFRPKQKLPGKVSSVLVLIVKKQKGTA